MMHRFYDAGIGKVSNAGAGGRGQGPVKTINVFLLPAPVPRSPAPALPSECGEPSGCGEGVEVQLIGREREADLDGAEGA